MKFLTAVLILSGMIIGVGMFGIPFSFWQSGFALGIAELAVLAAVVTTLHLVYGEVVLAASRQHRLPGYARLYLGRPAEWVALASAVFGIIGTLLAYLVLGAVFLNNLASPLLPESSEFLWAAVMAGLGILIVRFPTKKEALINGVLTVLLIAFIAVLVAVLLPRVEPRNLAGIKWGGFFAPYGVLLFSLAGGTVIPDVVTYLGKRPAASRLAILTGSLVPAFVYAFFAVAVLGVAGPGVSREAIAGLAPLVGPWVSQWGSAVGFLAVFTSFIALSGSFEALLILDLGVGRMAAWLIAAGLPFLAYLAGATDFIRIIGLVGAISVGIDGALVIAMRLCVGRARRASRGKAGGGVSKPVSLAAVIWFALVFLMLIAGIGYEVVRFYLSVGHLVGAG